VSRAVRPLSALLIAFVLITRPAEARVFDPTIYTLPNGLQLVVIENHSAPIATHMVWYRVGAADEAWGKSGIAHFLEHLMFKGTPATPAGEFSRLVARNGGAENAFTTQDYTAYFQSVAVDRLELVMGLEADRMANLVLTDAVVLPERDVVLEERRQRIENDPAAKLGEMATAAFYLNHPYREPGIGWEHEIRSLGTAVRHSTEEQRRGSRLIADAAARVAAMATQIADAGTPASSSWRRFAAQRSSRQWSARAGVNTASRQGYESSRSRTGASTS